MPCFFEQFADMENMNLQHMSLFLDGEIYLVPGENHQIDQHIRPGSAVAVAEVEASDAELVDDAPALEFEGDFEKAIMLIHDEKQFSPEVHEMIFKMLGALQCSLKDIALIQADRLEGQPMDLVVSMNPAKVIVFGLVRHDLMTIQKNKYETTQEEGIEYLFADSLGTISDNRDLKRSLWNELQVLFNIKK